ncbi:MAG: C40 family peptidase [Lachnospiraceae bacterium]|nr:C40 family peptidase [Lachnospiraceae bacterium]
MKKRGLKLVAGILVITSVMGTNVNANAKSDVEKYAVNIPDAGIAIALQNYDINNYTKQAELTQLINETVMATEDSQSEPETKAAEEQKETETKKEEETAEAKEEQKEKSIYDSIAMTKVEDYVNVRENPNTDAEIVGKIYNNCAATILEVQGDWYKIVSGNVTGYIKSDYFVTGEEAKEIAVKCGYVNATVTTETLNVRENQGTESTILTQLPEGGVFDVVEYGNGWVYLNVDGDVQGWVSMDFVDISVSFNTALTLEEEQARIEEEERKKAEAEEAERKAQEAKELEEQRKREEQAERERAAAQAAAEAQSANTYYEETYTEPEPEPVVNEVYDTSTSSAMRDAVVAYALQFVGNPYVYGGSSLTNGTDCSGFTMSVYSHFGYSLPHQSGSQSSCGVRVSTDSLLPGDLLFYSSGGSGIGHVALYIGGGQVVHASTPATGIKVSDAFYRSPICAVRIIQ